MIPSIELADGRPIASSLVAVLDETTPEVGAGVYYVVASAVIVDLAAITGDLKLLFEASPSRLRPFHWHKEGPIAKQRMIDVIISNGLIAHSRYRSVARKNQSQARSQLLIAISQDLEVEGVQHLIIESGDSSTNERDRQALLDYYRDRGGVPFEYDWRSKKEPLLWVADALNGAIHSELAHQDSNWLDQLVDAGVLQGRPVYTQQKCESSGSRPRRSP